MIKKNNVKQISNQEPEVPAKTASLDLSVLSHDPTVLPPSATSTAEQFPDEPVELEALTGDEQSALERCEAVVGKTKQAFIDLALALHEIKRDRLYRGNYPSLAEYCEQVHGIHRSYAYRLAAAGAYLAEQLTTGNSELPATERATRKAIEQKKREQTTKVPKADGKQVAAALPDPSKEPAPDQDREVFPTDPAPEPANPTVQIPVSTNLATFAQIHEWLEKAYNIFSDSTRRQEALTLIARAKCQVKRYAELAEAKQKAA